MDEIKRTELKKFLEREISEEVNCFFELGEEHLLIYVAENILIKISTIDEIAKYLDTTLYQFTGRILIFNIGNQFIPVYDLLLENFHKKCIEKIINKNK